MLVCCAQLDAQDQQTPSEVPSKSSTCTRTAASTAVACVLADLQVHVSRNAQMQSSACTCKPLRLASRKRSGALVCTHTHACMLKASQSIDVCRTRHGVGLVSLLDQSLALDCQVMSMRLSFWSASARQKRVEQEVLGLSCRDADLPCYCLMVLPLYSYAYSMQTAALALWVASTAEAVWPKL